MRTSLENFEILLWIYVINERLHFASIQRRNYGFFFIILMLPLLLT